MDGTMGDESRHRRAYGALDVAGEIDPFASGSATPNLGDSNGNSEQTSLLGQPRPRLEGTASEMKRRKKRQERWERFSRRSLYYIPILDWLPQYSANALVGDLIAGMTIACLLIPVSISYSTQLAHLQPVNGLFSAAIPSIIYPLLGTGRTLSTGPEAALSLLMGQLIVSLVEHDKAHNDTSPEEADAFAAMISALLTFEGGIITFLFGLLRLGFLDAVLSKALLRGFITAAGIVICIEQTIPMLGLATLERQSGVEGTIPKIFWIIRHLSTSHHLTTFISLVTLASLFAFKIVKHKAAKWVPALASFPETFFVTVIATLITAHFNWDQSGVDVLGSVKAGNTSFQFPMASVQKRHIKDTLGMAVTVTVIGFVDSIVVAKDQAARGGYSVSPNRELVALGAANVASSFVSGALPAFGSIPRSRLNGAAGATTQLASLFTGITVLLVTFFALPLLYHLPKCVLAATIFTIVLNLVAEAPHDFAFFLRLRGWQELSLMMFTFCVSVFWDLQTGVLLSLTASLVLTVKDATQLRVRILGKVPNTDQWEPIDAEMEGEEEVEGVLVVRIRESITFANAGGLKERLRRLEMYGPVRQHPSTSRQRDSSSALVFHFGDVEVIDASALQVLWEIVEEYKTRNVVVYFCHVKTSQKDAMTKAGIVSLVGEDHFSLTVNAALLMHQTDFLSAIMIDTD